MLPTVSWVERKLAGAEEVPIDPRTLCTVGRSHMYGRNPSLTCPCRASRSACWDSKRYYLDLVDLSKCSHDFPAVVLIGRVLREYISAKDLHQSDRVVYSPHPRNTCLWKSRHHLTFRDDWWCVRISDVWSFLYKQCTSSLPLFQRNTNKQTHEVDRMLKQFRATVPFFSQMV